MQWMGGERLIFMLSVCPLLNFHFNRSVHLYTREVCAKVTQPTLYNLQQKTMSPTGNYLIRNVSHCSSHYLDVHAADANISPLMFCQQDHCLIYIANPQSRDYSVGKAKGYELDARGWNPEKKK
jgi:hypothetical protein